MRDWDSLLFERGGGLWLPTHVGRREIAEQAAAVEIWSQFERQL